MKLSHTIAHNVTWLTSAEVISRLIVFFAVVRLANRLGDQGFGELSYGFAIANLLVVIADFGLANYIVRELAKRVSDGQIALRELLAFKCFLVIFALIAILVIGRVTTPLSFWIILGGGLAIVLTNTRMFFEAVFRAQGKMYLEAFTKLSHAALLAGVLWYLTTVIEILPVMTVAIGYAIMAAFSVVLAGVLLLILTPLPWPWLKTPSSTLVQKTWPFATSIGINAQFNYLDSAMLGWFGFVSAVGWYAAAYKPIFFMTALAGMIINAFLPTIAKEYHKNDKHFTFSVRTLLRVNLLFAVPVAIGGTLLAPQIMDVLYTEEFLPAVPAFQILLWSTVGISVWAVFGNVLQVCGHEREYLKNFVLALMVTIVGNSLLIPVYSLYGAAIATLATQLTLCILMYRSYKKHIRPLYATA